MSAAADNALDGLAGLSLIVLSDDYERVHYALSMAAAALAIDRPVILFFTNRALHALARDDAAGPGWHRLQQDAAGRSAAQQDAERRARGVAGFAELLDACIELGARIVACEMGLRVAGLSAAELRPDAAAEVAGLVTLYAATAAPAQLVVI